MCETRLEKLQLELDSVVEDSRSKVSGKLEQLAPFRWKEQLGGVRTVSSRLDANRVNARLRAS